MRYWWRLPALGLGLLVTLGAISSSWSQTPEPPPVHPEFASLPTLADLDRHLTLRSEERRRNDESTADLELENVFRLREALGLRSLAPLGIALRLEGRSALASGEVEAGLTRLAQAATLIPDTPGVHYELALAQVHHQGDIPQAVRSLTRGVEARFRGFENRALLLSDTLGVLGAAWLLALALFLVVQLIRYLDMAGHDIARRIPGVTRVQGWLLAVLLLFAPVALGLGPLPLLVLGLLLVGLYQTRRERVVTIAGYLGILALAGGIYASAPLLSFRDSDARAIHIVATRLAPATLRARAAALAERDPEAAFVLGLDARRRGDLASAEKYYRRALEAGRTAPRLNNLANVLFWRQQPEEAKKLYAEAIKLGTHAEPALNLGAVLIEVGQTAEGRAQASAGRAIDPAMAEAMKVDLVGVPAARKLRDAPYDEGVLLPMLLTSSTDGQRWPVLEDVAVRLLGNIPASAFGAAVLLFIVLLLALKDGPSLVSTACERCGAPAQRGKVEPHCSTCCAVFLEVSVADPKVRFKKEQEIRRRRRFERWRERLLCPIAGCGELVIGNPLLGFTLLLVVSVAVAHFSWLQSYGFYPWTDWAEPEFFRLVVSGLLAVPVTVISLKRGLVG